MQTHNNEIDFFMRIFVFNDYVSAIWAKRSAKGLSVFRRIEVVPDTAKAVCFKKVRLFVLFIFCKFDSTLISNFSEISLSPIL
jgi:hypothetical protein